ncbi:MAG: helix-turn-helix transcriptional regulator [Chitinophagaceae bacterium]|nr:helix-turn-helix transcriptional regulator [Chitinophagaceae bacterium]
MAHTIHHGNNLRCIRQLLGMKQEAFARAMGTTQQHISKLEKRETISKKKLEDAARVLGLPVEAIEQFDETSLLKLPMPAKQDDLPHSMKEVIEYFKVELAKKDEKIMELQCELKECRITKD